MSNSTTQGQLYFIALTTLDRLEFQYVPKDIKIVSQGNFPEVVVVGRNTPVYHYTGGSKSIELELDFHSITANKEDVIKKVQWVESLRYSNGDEDAPQSIKVIWGDLFKDETWIVTKVQSTISMFDKVNGMLPRQAYVKVTLLADNETNVKWSDIQR